LDVLTVGFADVVPVREGVLDPDAVTVGVPVGGAVGVACDEGVPEIVFVRVPDTVLELVCVEDRVTVDDKVELRDEENEGVKVIVAYAELVAVRVAVFVIDLVPLDVRERVLGAV
jgi:hypothetical protein